MQYVFHVGRLVAHEGRFELSYDGAPVEVQPLVLDTLFFLLRNVDRLVSKEELICGPWRHACVSDGSLYRCIMLIRKVLVNCNAPAKVVTVRSRGVRLTGNVIRVPSGSAQAPLFDAG